MENNEKYPLGKLILVAIIGFISAVLFFSVRGFAYDLELGNYDFNGFDSNADFIFEDFIENDMDVYNNTTYENLNLLIQKLKDNGYTDEYINNYRIKVQTTVNESYAPGSSALEHSGNADDPSSITELTEENGATDAIIRESNTELTDEMLENLYTDEQNQGETVDNTEIITILEDISNQIATLNRLTEENQAFYLADREEDTQSIFDKPINEFTVIESIGVFIVFALLCGVVVFFCLKFTPHYSRL